MSKTWEQRPAVCYLPGGPHPVVGPTKTQVEVEGGHCPPGYATDRAGSACSPLTQCWSWFHSQPRLEGELPREGQCQLPHLVLYLNPFTLSRDDPELLEDAMPTLSLTLWNSQSYRRSTKLYLNSRPSATQLQTDTPLRSPSRGCSGRSC